MITKYQKYYMQYYITKVLEVTLALLLNSGNNHSWTYISTWWLLPHHSRFWDTLWCRTGQYNSQQQRGNIRITQAVSAKNKQRNMPCDFCAANPAVYIWGLCLDIGDSIPNMKPYLTAAFGVLLWFMLCCNTIAVVCSVLHCSNQTLVIIIYSVISGAINRNLAIILTIVLFAN